MPSNDQDCSVQDKDHFSYNKVLFSLRYVLVEIGHTSAIFPL